MSTNSKKTKSVKSVVKKAKTTVKKAKTGIKKSLHPKKKGSTKDMSKTKKIVTGAIVGGAVGCIAATMLRSKNKGLVDTCKEYTDKFNGLLQDMKDNVSDKKEYVTDKAHDIIDSVKDEIGDFPSLDNSDFTKGLIVGSAVGSLLGSGSTMLYKHFSKDTPIDWKEMAQQVLKLLDVNTHTAEKFLEKAEKKATKVSNDVLDFAEAGIQLWKKIKK